MRKFIIVITMLMVLSNVNAFAQFQKTHADERDIAEWKSAQKKITSGKVMAWSSLAVGGIATSVGLVVMTNAQSHINNGEKIYYEVTDNSGNHVAGCSYEELRNTAKTVVIITDVVCVGVAITGLVLQKQGRKMCDKLYFSSGGITYSF